MNDEVADSGAKSGTPSDGQIDRVRVLNRGGRGVQSPVDNL
jgi:hypothetical protein